MRVHQEDCCQSLGRMPDGKYQNEGGPTAAEIFALIRDNSSRSLEDAESFLNALIFNWLIGGTDAHSKNYGFLLSGGGRVRLAPLYDLSSCLLYPREIPLMKAKLSMKIGGQYRLHRIGPHEWEKGAKEWHLSRDLVFDRIIAMAEAVENAATEIDPNVSTNAGRQVMTRLADAIADRVHGCLSEFSDQEGVVVGDAVIPLG